jgi:hypothetical protein
VTSHAILWRRLDGPGHDACRLDALADGWRLTGTALLALPGRACRLSYHLECDEHWRARSARLGGWLGDRDIEIAIVGGPGRWRLDGTDQLVTGCVDVDFGLTPATNLPQLRRLSLAVGDAGDAPAAWLRFPEMVLERLEQRYRRLTTSTYDYHAPGVGYAGILEVDPIGFVTRYPGLWEAERLE